MAKKLSTAGRLGRWKAMSSRERIAYALAFITSKPWVSKEIDWLIDMAEYGIAVNTPQEGAAEYVEASDERLKRINKALRRLTAVCDQRGLKRKEEDREDG